MVASRLEHVTWHLRPATCTCCSRRHSEWCRTTFQLRTFTVMAGFSLTFGALFAKTWRVYLIFTNTTGKVVRGCCLGYTNQSLPQYRALNVGLNQMPCLNYTLGLLCPKLFNICIAAVMFKYQFNRNAISSAESFYGMTRKWSVVIKNWGFYAH